MAVSMRLVFHGRDRADRVREILCPDMWFPVLMKLKVMQRIARATPCHECLAKRLGDRWPTRPDQGAINSKCPALGKSITSIFSPRLRLASA